MTILNTDSVYEARITHADIISEEGIKGRSGTTRSQHYRALNCELEVLDESGKQLGLVPWGIPVTQTATKNCALIRFFKSVGIFHDPETFNPKDLEGLEVVVAVNTVCDSHWGIRTVIAQFFPKNV